MKDIVGYEEVQNSHDESNGAEEEKELGMSSVSERDLVTSRNNSDSH